MKIINKGIIIKDLNNIKKKYPNIPDSLFPNFYHKVLRFELIDAKTSFANAIRRVCLNELEMKYLNLKDDIIVDSKDHIFQVLANRICQIPILQNIKTNTEFYLNVKNDTSELMHVMTDQIKNTNNKDNTIYFNQNIKVCTLKPNTSIKMNFNIKTGYGCIDGKYSACCVEYDILDADYNKPSVGQTNKHFALGIESFGNIEPVDLIKKTCSTLTDRLLKIQQNISTSNINITVQNNIHQYQIDNESHTISKLLTEYIYNQNPNIELINDEQLRVPDNKIYINIIHPDPNNAIISAITSIISDLNQLSTHKFN